MKLLAISILLILLISACVSIGFLWGLQKHNTVALPTSKAPAEHVIKKIEPSSEDVKNKKESQDTNNKKVTSKK